MSIDTSSVSSGVRELECLRVCGISKVVASLPYRRHLGERERCRSVVLDAIDFVKLEGWYPSGSTYSICEYGERLSIEGLQVFSKL